MDFAASLLAIVLVNVLAWLTPGSNMLAVMSASLTHGRRQGLATGFGLACGATIWCVLAVLGVAILFEVYPNAVRVLKLAGGAYLIWLGFKSLRDTMRPMRGSAIDARPVPGRNRAFATGLIVSLTNPKAALFFGSVLTAFIPASAPGWFLIVTVAVCAVLAAGLHSVTATVFSLPAAMRLFDRFKRGISGVFGLLFVGMGGAVVVSVLRRG